MHQIDRHSDGQRDKLRDRQSEKKKKEKLTETDRTDRQADQQTDRQINGGNLSFRFQLINIFLFLGSSSSESSRKKERSCDTCVLHGGTTEGRKLTSLRISF